MIKRVVHIAKNQEEARKWDKEKVLEFYNMRRELENPNYVIQFGVPPNRIDLMNSIDGVHFEDGWKEKKSEYLSFGDKKVPVYFISLKHLLINKRQSDRDKDRDDLSYLNNIHPAE